MTKLQGKRSINGLALLFAATYMVSYITRINFGAIISAVVEDTAMTKSMLSMAITGSFITYGLGQIISGICGDRFSPKRLVSYGFVVTIFMNLLIPLWENHIYMLVVWSINGFAQAFMWPPLVKMMTELLSADDYKKTTAKVAWGSSLGTILIYLLSPILISLFGWRSVFVFSAVCGVIMLFVWNKFNYDISVVTEKTAELRNNADKKQPLLNPLLICIMIAIALQGMLRDGITTWMPSYIAETYNISNIISILSGVLLPVFTIVCVQAAAKLYRSKFENPLSCSGVFFGVGALSALLLLLITGKNAAFSVCCSAILTGCMHGVNLMLVSMLPPFFQKIGKVSTISGLLNSFTYVGSAISTYVIALFADKFGWYFNLQVWFCIAVLGTILTLICARPWRKRYM